LAEVLFGSDGYLFLAGDNNAAIDQHTGKRPITKKQLAEWVDTTTAREKYFEALNIPYYMQIVPDKHSVYSEYLPVNIIKDSKSNASNVIAALTPVISEHLMFAKADLIAAKAGDQVYHKIDTHWTDKGAYIGYLQLVECLRGRFPALSVLETPEYKTKWFGGDLGSMQKLKVSSEAEVLVEHAGYLEVFNNRVPVTGKIQVYENKFADNDLVLLIFGGSSTVNFLKFITFSFKRVVFCWSGVLDYKLVDYYSPDVVLNQIRERFLIRPADDIVGINPSEAAFIKGFSIEPKRNLGFGVQEYSKLFIQCLAKISVKENNAYVKDLKALSKKMGLLPLFYYASSINMNNVEYEDAFLDLYSRLVDISTEISKSDVFDVESVGLAVNKLKLPLHDCIYMDYLIYGHLLDYKSSLLFDGKLYLSQYADVDEAGMNPLWHYERHGKGEGRALAG
jgi:alginate O-acetyltransferase complex protein AlgJ